LVSFGGYIKQGFLSVVTDQRSSLEVIQENTNTTDGSMETTVWQAFPGTPPAVLHF